MRAVAAARDPPATLSKIAGVVGLKIATTRRVLQALAAERLLLFDSQKKTYRLGPDLIAITAAGDEVFSLRDLLMAACREVAAKTSDTTILMVRRGDCAICIERVEGAFPIRVMSLDVGSIRPLGAGSGSLALIAFLPDAEVEEILVKNDRSFANYSLTSKDVAALIKEARNVGYTFNPGLILPGVFGIGVPIYRDGAVVASVSVAAIEQRLGQARRGEIFKLAKKAIGKIPNFSANP